MSDSRGSTDATGTTLHQQTETSPLKQNEKKKNWLSRIFWSSTNEKEQGSLRTIVLNFFVFTVIVTLALIAQLYYGGFQIKPHGSVASDSEDCSEIGKNILKKGGNAVDAAIASTLCLGVVDFYVTGLGGGGYMMIYNHMKREVIDILDFHSTVPNSLVNTDIDTSIDGLTVGVPGLLMGMWVAHQSYGKLHWEELIRPAADLAKNGFIVSDNTFSARNRLKSKSRYNKNLVQFMNSINKGENISFPDLAATLEVIAISGPYALYNGTLAKDIVNAVQYANGSMSLDDLSQYQISHSELLHTKFGNFDILAPGTSSGGALLLNALDTIQFLDLKPDDDISSIILKMSDTLHDAYVSFLEKNDAMPLKSQPAASQISAVDNEEIYVVVVSGLNTWLGSQILTKAGFILNNAVENGGIDDDRRPLSLYTPVIALESGEICGKRFLLGSGDATVAAQVLTNALILNYNATASVECPRFMINNAQRTVGFEELHLPFYDDSTLNRLGQLLKIKRVPLPYTSVNIIEKEGDNVYSHSDSRGGGLASKF